MASRSFTMRIDNALEDQINANFNESNFTAKVKACLMIGNIEKLRMIEVHSLRCSKDIKRNKNH